MLIVLALATAPPAFDPLRFFAGHTEGIGRLRVIMHHPRDVRVHGRGRIEAGGALVLTQQVADSAAPPRTRRWRIVETAPGHYTGTLTDARGPVIGWLQGGALRLRFQGDGGVTIDQRLSLAADGRVAYNRLTARKLGVIVARLDETISRSD